MPHEKTLLSIFGFDPKRLGACEIFIRELSAGLHERGWNHVVCLAGSPPENVRSYLTLANVRLEVFEAPWSVNWKSVRRLNELLRLYRPRIMHLNFVGFLGPYPWLARLAPVEKIFFTDHTSQPEGHRIRVHPLWKRILIGAINHPITAVVSVSDYGRRCMVETRIMPRERSRRIYNGIEIERAAKGSGDAFRRRFQIPDGRFIVAQVSWLIPAKGIGDALEAARLVLDKEPNVQFVFVGEGAHRQEYESKARELGIGAHVTWTGLLQDPLAEGVYAAADIVCQFSRWEEVFGQVIAEAMAAGKPVVATRVGGIPELVEDGKTGFLVERGDTAAMAARILTLLADSGLRERMGSAGHRAAEEKFNVALSVREMLDLYGIG